MTKEILNNHQPEILKTSSFASLFNQIISTEDDIIFTENNKSLIIDKDERAISIKSFISTESFYLESDVDFASKIIIFNLKTRSEKNNQKHPDLYAGEFIRLSLEYFQKKGIIIRACCGLWQEDSDNYELFMDEYKKSKNEISAAKNTWSGKQFIKNGFTKINKTDITIAEQKNSIKAIFKKPY